MGNLAGTQVFTELLAHPRVRVRPRVFVELGTFEGRTAAMASEVFDQVHTVELSPEYYGKARAAHPGRGIRFHQGRSRDILPTLAASIEEPAVFYHDAHWWPHPGVAKSFPLWDDLATIAARPYADIILVDEVHRFGDTAPTPHWAAVSLERIAACFPGHQAAEIHGNLAMVIR